MQRARIALLAGLISLATVAQIPAPALAEPTPQATTAAPWWREVGHFDKLSTCVTWHDGYKKRYPVLPVDGCYRNNEGYYFLFWM